MQNPKIKSGRASGASMERAKPGRPKGASLWEYKDAPRMRQSESRERLRRRRRRREKINKEPHILRKGSS